MLAKHIMTRDIITAQPTMTVKDFARLLNRNQISGAPVVDKGGKLVGVVSEADVISKKGKNVRAIMTKKTITVEEDTPVEKIAELMTQYRINRLPVLDGKRIIGIVSRADIVSAIASGDHIILHTPVYDL